VNLQLVVMGAREAAEWARRADGNLQAGVVDGLTRGALLVEAAAKKLVYAGHDEHLERKTGHLRQSLTHRVDGPGLYAEVGTNVKYAAIHEFGGVVKPKGHPFLSIPIGTRKGSPTQYKDLHFVRTLEGKAYLIDSRGKAQYRLARQVTIRARPYLQPALEQSEEKVADAMTAAVWKAIEPK